MSPSKFFEKWAWPGSRDPQIFWALNGNSSKKVKATELWCACFQGQFRHDLLKHFLKRGHLKKFTWQRYALSWAPSSYCCLGLTADLEILESQGLGNVRQFTEGYRKAADWLNLRFVYRISVVVSVSAGYSWTKQTSEVCVASHLARLRCDRRFSDWQNNILLASTLLHFAAKRQLLQITGIRTWGQFLT